MKKSILPLALSLFAFEAGAQVVINEIMQSNIDCIMDDLNDFPDSWVELYNSGTAEVDLKDFSLGTSDDASKAWNLPSEKISAGGYVLVYCDKVGSGFHTDYRLESGKGCTLFLFKNGAIVDKLPDGLKKQPSPNIAYGRKTDANESWGYMIEPTPGKANCGKTTKDILGEPVFSKVGSVFETGKSTSLTLSLPEGAPADAVIRYTTDGSEPTAESTLYSGPISISKTKIVRAKLFCDGWLSPRSTTHSYLFLGRKMTLPVISLTTNNDYFYDDNIGIYVDGKSSVKNYKNDWRRPVNLEFFEESDKESVLNQLCETRVTGGASRDAQSKSLGLYANKRFGEKRFNYEFFPDQKPGLTDFKSIMLRNAGNDFSGLYMRDAIIQRLISSNRDIDWQAWRPSIIFINGEYRGILNIRERSNEENIYTNYGGLEDIDMVENWNEMKEGRAESWEEFQNFYKETGHTYAEFNERMDVQEFMDVMIMNLFFNNLDFPGNNIVLWRPQAEGGRWRVVVKDTDFGLGLYGRDVNYKIFEWLYNPDYDPNNRWGANSSDGTRLFRRLMDDKDFYREFIDRCAIYIGDFMNFDRAWEIWEPMRELIKYEYENGHKPKYYGWSNYDNELNNAKTWIQKRPEKFYSQINSYYKVGTPVALTINKSISAENIAKMTTSFNGVDLTRAVFDGKFFAGREITLKASKEDDFIGGWSITQTNSNGSVSRWEVGYEEYKFKMPNCKKLEINAIYGRNGVAEISAGQVSWRTSDGVIELTNLKEGTSVQLYNIQGVLLQDVKTMDGTATFNVGAHGIYMIKAGSQTMKIRL